MQLTLVLMNKLRSHTHFLIFSQSDYLIKVVDIDSYTEWQTVQIQISWLPTDLDLYCLQRQGISGFSRTRVMNIPLDTTEFIHKHLKSLIFLIFSQSTFKLMLTYIIFTLNIGTPCDTVLKFVPSPFYCLIMCSENCWMNGK